jgi:hypothetical protein
MGGAPSDFGALLVHRAEWDFEICPVSMISDTDQAKLSRQFKPGLEGCLQRSRSRWGHWRQTPRREGCEALKDFASLHIRLIPRDSSIRPHRRSAPGGGSYSQSRVALSTQTLNSEIVEFTKNGKFVVQFSIDSANGAAFGIATAPAGEDSARLAAVDDAMNGVTVFTLCGPRKIDFVGAVRVGRMDARLDVGGVVVQQIEHVTALVLVGADDAGVERQVVGHVGVVDDALLQTSV